MSKIAVSNKVPAKYDAQALRDAFQQIETQVNGAFDGDPGARQTRTSAPTSGRWRQGAIVWDSAPSAGGTMGWVCVASGEPGTWKTFGSIAA